MPREHAGVGAQKWERTQRCAGVGAVYPPPSHSTTSAPLTRVNLSPPSCAPPSRAPTHKTRAPLAGGPSASAAAVRPSRNASGSVLVGPPVSRICRASWCVSALRDMRGEAAWREREGPRDTPRDGHRARDPAHGPRREQRVAHRELIPIYTFTRGALTLRSPRQWPITREEERADDAAVPPSMACPSRSRSAAGRARGRTAGGCRETTALTSPPPARRVFRGAASCVAAAGANGPHHEDRVQGRGRGGQGG